MSKPVYRIDPRYEMIDILRKNNFATPAVPSSDVFVGNKRSKQTERRIMKGSILQNFILAANFLDKIFFLKFWTKFHPKTTFINLSYYFDNNLGFLRY
jgi:hypothetical protein